MKVFLLSVLLILSCNTVSNAQELSGKLDTILSVFSWLPKAESAIAKIDSIERLKKLERQMGDIKFYLLKIKEKKLELKVIVDIHSTGKEEPYRSRDKFKEINALLRLLQSTVRDVSQSIQESVTLDYEMELSILYDNAFYGQSISIQRAFNAVEKDLARDKVSDSLKQTISVTDSSIKAIDRIRTLINKRIDALS